MSFNSFVFLLVFLPITLIVYWYLKGHKHKEAAVWFLIMASLFFYAVKYPSSCVIFAFSLVFNYMTSLQIISERGNDRRKRILVIGVLFDILLLSFFKYGPLVNSLIGDRITAPGISFYTFCEIALLFECYRGTVTTLSVSEYSLMMTFFPKLIEGPIVCPKDMLPQQTGKEKLDYEEIFRIIYLFSIGLFKKVIIAETLRKAVDYGFADLNSMHTGEALVIMLSYTLQIYFDFSGYTDMARALAKAFGFELPVNFDSPYKATDICDFWKRWHITLTNFLTRYLYIPLGGNRKGKGRMYINFLIVFMISGLWHGAGWQFLVWGMLHGILYVVTRFIRDKFELDKAKNRLGKDSAKECGENNAKDQSSVKVKTKKIRILDGIKMLGTFLYVNIAWVFFRAPSLKEALHLFEDIGQFWFPRFNYGLAKCFNIEELWYLVKIFHLDGFNNSIYFLMIAILVALCMAVFHLKSSSEYVLTCKIGIINTLIMAVLLLWSLLSFEGVATYIYVNF